MTTGYNLSLTTHPNLRTEVLISLTDGKKDLSDLRKDLNVGSTTISHSLRELEENKLIQQDTERYYFLTNIGKIIANGLIDVSDTVETLYKFESFWLSRSSGRSIWSIQYSYVSHSSTGQGPERCSYLHFFIFHSLQAIVNNALR